MRPPGVAPAGRRVDGRMGNVGSPRGYLTDGAEMAIMMALKVSWPTWGQR